MINRLTREPGRACGVGGVACRPLRRGCLRGVTSGCSVFRRGAIRRREVRLLLADSGKTAGNAVRIRQTRVARELPARTVKETRQLEPGRRVLAKKHARGSDSGGSGRDNGRWQTFDHSPNEGSAAVDYRGRDHSSRVVVDVNDGTICAHDAVSFGRETPSTVGGSVKG